MKNIAVILIATILCLNSCSTEKHVVAEQPVAPVYTRPEEPGPGYIWVEGNWHWRSGKYVFENGDWVKPKQNKTWVTGSWMKTDKGYYWQKGYWQ